MSSRYLVVAKEAELQLPLAAASLQGGYRKPIITGVGATNIIQALRKLPAHADILNVGYCGSCCFPIGSVIWVGQSKLWHPNVTFEETTFSLMPGQDTICLTSGDFVLDRADLPENSVVDMELAFIAAFGFQSLKAVKYVSDKLNYNEYEQCLKK